MAEWRYSCTILDLPTRCMLLVSLTLLPLFPGEEATGTHWILG
jgi:hypothetical protein